MSNVQANFRCKLWLPFPHCMKNSMLDFHWLLSVPIKKPKQTKHIKILLDSKWVYFIEVCPTSQRFYPLYRKLIPQPLECFSNNNNTVCTPGLSQTEYHFTGLLQDFQELFQVFRFQREKKKIVDNKIWTRLLSLVAQHLVYRELNYGTYSRWFTCSGRWSVRAVLRQFFLQA